MTAKCRLPLFNLPDDPRIRLNPIVQEKKEMSEPSEIWRVACKLTENLSFIGMTIDWYPADRVTRQIAALQSPSGREFAARVHFYYYERPTIRAEHGLIAHQNRGRHLGWQVARSRYRKSLVDHASIPEIQVGEDSRFGLVSARNRDFATSGLRTFALARIHPQEHEPQSHLLVHVGARARFART